MMHKTKNRRDGFTLVEILVVIAIIGILAALTTTGVFVVIGSQQRRNTVNTMRVIDKLLNDRWHTVVEDAKKEPISQTTHANLFTLAGNDPGVARVIWIKVRLVEAFPVSYSEVQMAPAVTIVNTYIPANKRKPHFNKYQSTLSGFAIGQPGESSACLLMALQTLQSDGVSTSDQLRHVVVNRDGPTSPNKVDTLNDGWGLPLVFVRFGTGPTIDAANPAKPATPGNPATWNRAYKFADSVDTEGVLLKNAWYNAAPVPPPPPQNYRQKFELQFGYQIAAAAPPSLNARANFVVPVVTSAGKDNKLGTADDIINFQLRGE